MKSYPNRPVSRSFGFDRGQPVDRYFIDQFLEENKVHIKGKLLEIGDASYSKKFGQDVESFDVLDIEEHEDVTLVGNLETGVNLPSNTFDCFILTQVIHLLYDLQIASEMAMNVLKPGGTLLVTVPGISQSCRTKTYGDYWRFTSMSLKRLFQDLEIVESVDVSSYGNLPTAQAFLEGRASHELSRSAFSFHDPHYEVIMGAVIKKSVEIYE